MFVFELLFYNTSNYMFWSHENLSDQYPIITHTNFHILIISINLCTPYIRLWRLNLHVSFQQHDYFCDRFFLTKSLESLLGNQKKIYSSFSRLILKMNLPLIARTTSTIRNCLICGVESFIWIHYFSSTQSIHRSTQVSC